MSMLSGYQKVALLVCAPVAGLLVYLLIKREDKPVQDGETTTRRTQVEPADVEEEDQLAQGRSRAGDIKDTRRRIKEKSTLPKTVSDDVATKVSAGDSRNVRTRADRDSVTTADLAVGDKAVTTVSNPDKNTVTTSSGDITFQSSRSDASMEKSSSEALVVNRPDDIATRLSDCVAEAGVDGKVTSAQLAAPTNVYSDDASIGASTSDAAATAFHVKDATIADNDVPLTVTTLESAIGLSPLNSAPPSGIEVDIGSEDCAVEEEIVQELHADFSLGSAPFSGRAAENNDDFSLASNAASLTSKHFSSGKGMEKVSEESLTTTSALFSPDVSPVNKAIENHSSSNSMLSPVAKQARVEDIVVKENVEKQQTSPLFNSSPSAADKAVNNTINPAFSVSVSSSDSEWVHGDEVAVKTKVEEQQMSPLFKSSRLSVDKEADGITNPASSVGESSFVSGMVSGDHDNDSAVTELIETQRDAGVLLNSVSSNHGANVGESDVVLTTNQQTLPADDKNTTVYVSGVSVKEPATDQMNANFTTQLQQANVQQVSRSHADEKLRCDNVGDISWKESTGVDDRVSPPDNSDEHLTAASAATSLTPPRAADGRRAPSEQASDHTSKSADKRKKRNKRNLHGHGAKVNIDGTEVHDIAEPAVNQAACSDVSAVIFDASSAPFLGQLTSNCADYCNELNSTKQQQVDDTLVVPENNNTITAVSASQSSLGFNEIANDIDNNVGTVASKSESTECATSSAVAVVTEDNASLPAASSSAAVVQHNTNARDVFTQHDADTNEMTNQGNAGTSNVFTQRHVGTSDVSTQLENYCFEVANQDTVDVKCGDGKPSVVSSNSTNDTAGYEKSDDQQSVINVTNVTEDNIVGTTQFVQSPSLLSAVKQEAKIQECNVYQAHQSHDECAVNFNDRVGELPPESVTQDDNATTSTDTCISSQELVVGGDSYVVGRVTDVSNITADVAPATHITSEECAEDTIAASVRSHFAQKYATNALELEDFHVASYDRMEMVASSPVGDSICDSNITEKKTFDSNTPVTSVPLPGIEELHASISEDSFGEVEPKSLVSVNSIHHTTKTSQDFDENASVSSSDYSVGLINEDNAPVNETRLSNETDAPIIAVGNSHAAGDEARSVVTSRVEPVDEIVAAAEEVKESASYLNSSSNADELMPIIVTQRESAPTVSDTFPKMDADKIVKSFVPEESISTCSMAVSEESDYDASASCSDFSVGGISLSESVPVTANIPPGKNVPFQSSVNVESSGVEKTVLNERSADSHAFIPRLVSEKVSSSLVNSSSTSPLSSVQAAATSGSVEPTSLSIPVDAVTLLSSSEVVLNSDNILHYDNNTVDSGKYMGTSLYEPSIERSTDVSSSASYTYNISEVESRTPYSEQSNDISHVNAVESSTVQSIEDKSEPEWGVADKYTPQALCMTATDTVHPNDDLSDHLPTITVTSEPDEGELTCTDQPQDEYFFIEEVVTETEVELTETYDLPSTAPSDGHDHHVQAPQCLLQNSEEGWEQRYIRDRLQRSYADAGVHSDDSDVVANSDIADEADFNEEPEEVSSVSSVAGSDNQINEVDDTWPGSPAYQHEEYEMQSHQALWPGDELTKLNRSDEIDQTYTGGFADEHKQAFFLHDSGTYDDDLLPDYSEGWWSAEMASSVEDTMYLTRLRTDDSWEHIDTTSGCLSFYHPKDAGTDAATSSGQRVTSHPPPPISQSQAAASLARLFAVKHVADRDRSHEPVKGEERLRANYTIVMPTNMAARPASRVRSDSLSSCDSLNGVRPQSRAVDDFSDDSLS